MENALSLLVLFALACPAIVLADSTMQDTLSMMNFSAPNGSVTISDIRPVRAWIDKKEKQTVDDCYYVYKPVVKTNSSQVCLKYRGVVRATKYIETNTETAEERIFYQTAGYRLNPGDVLKRHNDLGLEASLSREYGAVGGMNARIDYRIGRMVNIKALYAFLEGGVQTKEYRNLYSNDMEDNFFGRFGLGVAKGFQLLPDIEQRTYIGCGGETAWGSQEITASYAKIGTNLSLNVTHSVQVYGGVALYVFGKAYDEEENELPFSWNQYFPGRNGITTNLGIKVGF